MQPDRFRLFDQAGVRPLPTRPGIGVDSTRFGSPGAACNSATGQAEYPELDAVGLREVGRMPLRWT